MTLSREEIDKIVGRETKDPNKVDIKDEVMSMVTLLLISTIFGLVFYTIIGALVSYLSVGSFAEIRAWGEYYSGYGLFVAGLLISIGFFTGRSTFSAEMTRRAWSSSSYKNSEESMIRDMRNFMSFGRVTAIYSIGTLVAFILFFVIIPH